MQMLKVTLSEIDSFVRETKQGQQEQVKSVRNIYKQFVDRNEPDYKAVVTRIEANLRNKVEDTFQQDVSSMDFTADIAMFKMENIAPIDRQLEQARAVMNKGVGKVQQRDFSGNTQSLQPTQSSNLTKPPPSLFEPVTNSEVQRRLLRATKAAIMIQRWWRRLKGKPIYRHSDYFD